MNESGTHETKGTLAQRIVAAPQLTAAEVAHARVERWLAEIASSAAGRTLARLLAAHPTLNTLMAGAGRGLALSLGARTRRSRAARCAARIATRSGAFDDLLADAARLIAAAGDEAEVMRLLRRMKAEAALLIALADIGGVWPVMRGDTRADRACRRRARRGGALSAARSASAAASSSSPIRRSPTQGSRL